MSSETSRRRKDSSGSDASSISKIPISFTPTLPRRQKSNISLRSVRTNASRGDDVDSVCSGSSSICEHSHFAKNGSTYSGRSKRYIVHCSPTHTDPDDYLTPTQRANATIRKLKSMLSAAQSDVAARDEEISRLSRELVQLRLGDKKRELRESPERRAVNGSPRSLSDSGHFEELSPEPSFTRNQLSSCQASPCQVSPCQVTSSNGVNGIDALAQELADVNERYSELKPQYDDLCLRLERLEFEKAELEAKFEANEESHRKTYLEMFRKGQEAARFQVGDETDAQNKEKLCDIPKLLKELEVTKAELDSVKDVKFWERTNMLSGTEAVSIWNLCRKTMYRKMLESNTRKPDDAEITLKFLKSAFYYFLTDRENTTGHLSAIQSILGFSQEERAAIEKVAYQWK